MFRLVCQKKMVFLVLKIENDQMATLCSIKADIAQYLVISPVLFRKLWLREQEQRLEMSNLGKL